MEQTQEALELLCQFAADLKYENISEHDLKYLKLLFSDYFSAVFAGYRVNDEFNQSLRAVVFGMGGTEESSVICSDRRLPAASAALLNGCYAGGGEMDDGHRKANGHPGSSIISAVLAMAETLDVTERDVLTAIAVGYEFLCRLASATQPGQGGRGFHPTGVTGTLACAAACTKLLGLGKESFESAIAAAVLQCAGILTVETFKPLSPGKAAFNGVFSAKLVQNGAHAGNTALKKSTRWFKAISDMFDFTQITNGLGEKLALAECYIKPYPACRHLHGAIEAALALREEVDPFAATEIVVSLYKSAFGKATDITHPCNIAEAKFSTAFAAASAFVNGRFSLDDLDVEKVDPRVWELADKFTFVRDDSLEDRAKGKRGVKMEVIIGDERHCCQFDLPKGEPERPVTAAELREKMIMCAGDLLDFDSLQSLSAKLENFGTDKKFSPIRIPLKTNGD